MKSIKSYKKELVYLMLFLLIFIIGTVLISMVPKSVKISNKTLQTVDGEKISIDIFEPRRSLQIQKNAVIIGHGYMANKEFMKGYAIELAAAGFVVVTLDFRGHGQSTGVLSNNRLLYDVLAVKTYLATRLDIDIHNLAYIGYSMGGFPGNIIVNDDPDFKAFIGVGTSLQPLLRKGNSTHPLNVLMIYAKYDEAFKLYTLKQSVSVRTGIISSFVDVNQLYGSFQDGNATMIYLDDNSNHLSVAWDTDFIRASRNWLITTFPNTLAPDEDFHAHFRLLILIFQIIGGFGLFFALLYILARVFGFQSMEEIEEIIKEANSNEKDKTQKDQFKEKQIREEIEIDFKETSTKKLIALTLLLSILLGIVGIFLIVWVFLPLPQPIEGFILSLLFGQAFGTVLLLWRLGKKHGLSMRNIIGKPFLSDKKDLIKYIILGIILAGILYVILYLSFGQNYIGIVPSITKLPWIPLYMIIAFFIFLIYDINILLVIQPRFSNDLLGNIKIVVIHFGILFIYINTYLLLIGVLTGSLFFWGVMIPVSTPIMILSACIEVVSYRRTGNIITGAVINAIYFILIVTTIAPYQGFFTLFSVI